ETINFKSFGDDIYGSLCIPKNVTKPPVVVVLPARSITKEADLPMAQYLASMGYASITLDERGYGQTGGTFAGDWQNGFDSFVNGTVPVQYKQVYDALRAYDYVNSRSDLSGNDTAILGESIGGMWSIIAAGVEPQFKGVISISSSDFPLPVYDNTSAGNMTANNFLSSAQPSNYLSLLPPRKLVMIHFTNDPIIPIADGKALFDKASEPKTWYQYEGTTHGLPNATYMPDLQRELQGMLGK
ncbi:MAG TPA: prolyl oligopeptidase family serine peptidase, partial [Methanocellaceae archaeon]